MVVRVEGTIEALRLELTEAHNHMEAMVRIVLLQYSKPNYTLVNNTSDDEPDHEIPNKISTHPQSKTSIPS